MKSLARIWQGQAAIAVEVVHRAEIWSQCDFCTLTYPAEIGSERTSASEVQCVVCQGMKAENVYLLSSGLAARHLLALLWNPAGTGYPRTQRVWGSEA